MDTFTFKNIAVGSKFKVVDPATRGLRMNFVFTKTEPFGKNGLLNATYVDARGKECGVRFLDTDIIVFA